MNPEEAPKPEDPVKVEELEERAAEQAFAEASAESEASTASRMEEAIDPEQAATQPPDWAAVPPLLKMPSEGSQVAFIRIPAVWTRTPARGDRVCICWPINETEERLAHTRARGDAMRSLTELAKATIRAVDGEKADWSGVGSKKGSVSAFWTDIGPKGRAVIRTWYVRTHTVTDEEALDFFSKHFVNVTVQRA